MDDDTAGKMGFLGATTGIWLTGLALGLALGTAFGLALDDLGIGLALGAAFAFAFAPMMADLRRRRAEDAHADERR
jgi:hypothetical protein